MTNIEILLVILIVGTPLTVLVVCYFQLIKQLTIRLRKKIILRNAPTIQSNVTVSSKSIDIAESYGGPGTLSGKIVKTSYIISFDFPDKNRKCFEVDMYQQKSINENDTGILTYKEKGKYFGFVRFLPHSRKV